MPEDERVRIGRMKWPVLVARREQLPEANPGVGIAELFPQMMSARADIQPVGAGTYWGSMQVDAGITHRIFMRWFDTIDNECVIFRVTKSTESTPMTDVLIWERFRIRRWKELAGRKRFVCIECELEQRESVTPGVIAQQLTEDSDG
ncbi:head-tail adaptor protein [Kozakia baliensis]|uniref:Uncharacterized protein n=1 Tax=Kozakia baliensis TaxID=153496 RepID=A0A1D8UTF5_9PROT|nr:hypothetical protein [Kozakia baliensis]AOX16925.1 hypothetical protein A0U89_07005 [Kozakia baliensis]GBR25566.1 bacteriophage protein [Kozakia baliensis NRIC 0488]GEL64027.1 hypothetical protein KBA01_13130 [Kozakia baliensis]